MSCNGWNHPAGCSCGWGGIFHGASNVNALAWPTTPGSFVNPNARCPKCGDPVFFYRAASGGSVYFDSLGPPWPKHPCVAPQAVAEIPSSTYWQAVEYLNGPFLRKIPLAVFTGSDAKLTAWVTERLRSQIGSNHFTGAVATWVSVLPPSVIGEASFDLHQLNQEQVSAMAESIMRALVPQSARRWTKVCHEVAVAVLDLAAEKARYRASRGGQPSTPDAAQKA